MQAWQYAELHNSGYRGLYNGLDADGIHRLKKLTKNQNILDHMGAAEASANAFRITQAKLRMDREKPKTPDEAFAIAHDAGVRVRKTMEEVGGIMPENCQSPTASKLQRSAWRRTRHCCLRKSNAPLQPLNLSHQTSIPELHRSLDGRE